MSWARQQSKRLMKALNFLVRATYQHFRNDRCTVTASALTYVSLLAMVPVATVVFAIVQQIPEIQVGLQRLESFLISAFAPELGQDISLHLHRFVERTHQLQQWSLLILFLTVFWAFSTIEQAFNHIWDVPQPRRSWQRWLTYLVLILFGPLLLISGVAMTVYLSTQSMVSPLAATLLEFKPLYVLFVSAIPLLVFMCLYRWIPNQKVKWRYAALGGLIAALLFELSKRIFTLYLAWFPSHEVIYGTMALLPLLMIWLHLVWVIILLGAEVSFSIEQYAQNYRDKEQTNSE